ncbi:MAG TPA: MbcA/ParS/Xre antitoxin family protein [Marinobacter sp.]|uniref:MbcA/ParS/Xre antitoxin family protein n=1 Tax=Marinobacter sp. TaxID=50741 RepID=UPI002D7E835E|nr:MbcA/ParS/Xre antitoxin family protein [Marinobacter sp.]HET8801453.1 MbcA/ParS/Xre antitoxin family protein [Marinobacter sp.]
MDAKSQENHYEAASSILESWGLDSKQKGQLLRDHETVLNVLTIQDSLMCIFENDGDRAAAWPLKSNRAFDGASALDVMLSGDGERVRQYLKYHVYNA